MGKEKELNLLGNRKWRIRDYRYLYIWLDESSPRNLCFKFKSFQCPFSIIAIHHICTVLKSRTYTYTGKKTSSKPSIKDGISEILDKSSVRSYALRKAEEEKRC